MRSLLLLFLACACTPSAGPAAQPGPTGLAEDGSYYPSPPKELAEVTWRSAWVVGDKLVVPGASGAGRILSREGLRKAEPTGTCGKAPTFEGKGVLWLPDGDEVTFPSPPMVAAAVVERASWRLADVLGPPEGVLPGVDSKDPTLHQGIRVRAVNKLRRSGPPWQAIVGERRDRVGVAIADGTASELASGLVLRRTSQAPVDISVTTSGDIDGDGRHDVVIYGDGPEGAFRAVVSVLGLEGNAVLRSFEEAPKLACP